MPKVGFRYLVFAKKTANGYTDGFRGGKAVQGSATPNNFDVKFFGDDALAEEETGTSSYALSLEMGDLPLVALDVLFGHTVEGENVIYSADDKANEVGTGYYVTRVKGGVRYYDAYWYYNVKYTEPTESYTTKGETVTFNGDTIAGTASVNENRRFRERETFETDAAAEAWLNTKAGIVISG